MGPRRRRGLPRPPEVQEQAEEQGRLVLSAQGASDLDQLARDARAGDRSAFGQLVTRLQRPLQRFLVVRTGSPEDAEELVQESFLKAWEQLERYEPGRPFLPWLYTIARNLSASRGRADARRPASSLDEDPPSGEVDPAEAGSRAETADNLWQLASRVLGAEQRSALWLRYVDGLRPAEIAQVLERRPTTVRVLLFRARRTLARHLTASEHDAAPAPDGTDPRADVPTPSSFSTAPGTGGA